MSHRLLPALLLLAAATTSLAQDEPLGRLFMTPQQRSALDRERLLGLSQRQSELDSPVITVPKQTPRMPSPPGRPNVRIAKSLWVVRISTVTGFVGCQPYLSPSVFSARSSSVWTRGP